MMDLQACWGYYGEQIYVKNAEEFYRQLQSGTRVILKNEICRTRKYVHYASLEDSMELSMIFNTG